MRDRDDEDPGLPIKFGPASNAEYDPQPLTPVVREAIRRARADAERHARRTGMSRRDFLLSLTGAATTLLALDRCTREILRVVHGREPGGGFPIPPTATEDPDAAGEFLAGEEFILDVQGHLLEYDLNPATRFEPFFGDGFPQADCGEDDPRACFTMEHFLDLFFRRSDTDVVALSGLPIAPEGSPLSPEVMDETRRVVEALCQDERVLTHALTLPNVGSLEANLEAMEEGAQRYRIAAWKVFTHYPDLYTGNRMGWWLDDHEAGLPRVADAFIRKAVELGVPRICVHKGLSGGSPLASPQDIGPAAKRHPDARFIVYHSGYEVGTTEGPYTEETADIGVNRLVSSVRRAGLGHGSNVFAEIGSTWWLVMSSPDQAAHVLGKLLKELGPDNVLWGTDSIWYGSPQDQIMALRAFQISEEYQERYGYPALTQEVKAKILGLNAAGLYGVEPERNPRCHFTRRELQEMRKDLPARDVTLGPSTVAEARAVRAAHQGTP